MRFLENQKEVVDLELEEDKPDYPEPSRVPYVIEGMFPAGQVHLLGGPSGSGKTTLAFQMYEALDSGASFLGRQTRPVKWAYVSGDRTSASVQETQDRCGVAFKVFSLVDENLVGEDLLTKVMPRLTALYGYRPDFIYIDGFTALVPGGFLNNYAIVARWLASLQRYCWRMGVTIVGACHTTKTKEGEKFTNPRQRIAGSVAWAGFSETVLIIEPLDDDKEQDKRVVHILPRNFAGEDMILKFDDRGRLQIPEKVQHQEAITNFLMEGVMESLEAGTEIAYSAMKKVAKDKGVASRTFERWVKKFVDSGRLVKKSRGLYVLSEPSQLEEAGNETQASIQ